MKKHLPLLFIMVVFVAGLSVLLYPLVSDLINTRNQTRAVAAYHSAVTQLEQTDYEGMFAQAHRYNEMIFANQATPTQEHSDIIYEETLRVGASDVLGHVSIPKIDVKLPIYHGTSHAVLQNGIGHLEKTSLPVGGENTHAALSGHRGLPSAKLLTNLDQMELGDLISIHVLNAQFTYQVDQIEVVEPHEVDLLRVVPGGDFVTLITCTPYGVNTHRLLVRGTRVENPPQEEIVAVESSLPLDPMIPATLAAICLTVSILLGLLGRRKRYKRYPPDRRILPVQPLPATEIGPVNQQ